MSDLKARLRRWLKRILIVLAVFVLPPAAFYFYATWQAARELRTVLAELDAEQPSWRWEDLLAAQGKLQASEDLRELMHDISKSIPPTFGKSWKITDLAFLEPPNLAIGPERWQPFNKLMLTLETPLAESTKINRFAVGRNRYPWPAAISATDFDDAQKVRNFMSMMQCAAVWHARQGNLDAAMEDCLVMQRICQSLEDEPTVVVHLVRMALQPISASTSQRVLAQGQPRSTHLAQLQEAWEKFDRERALVNGLRGERAYCHRMFEAFTDGSLPLHAHPWSEWSRTPTVADIPFTERATAMYYRANLTEAHAWCLRHLTAHIEALNLIEPERAARQRELAREALNAPGVARVLMSAVSKLLAAHRRNKVYVRCLIVGLAAERFRRDHERWPKTLAELCPKFLTHVPGDPYNDAPLQLRVAPDGIVIYSVGPDGKQCGRYQDDHAATQSGGWYEFRLWNVNQRRLVDHRQP